MKQAMTKKDNAAIDPKAVAQMLADAERHLFSDSNKRAMELTLDWKNSFAKEAGVYVIFDEVAPLYVGESANLQKGWSICVIPITIHLGDRWGMSYIQVSPTMKRQLRKKGFLTQSKKNLLRKCKSWQFALFPSLSVERKLKSSLFRSMTQNTT